jgi:hypothetical protein
MWQASRRIDRQRKSVSNGLRCPNRLARRARASDTAVEITASHSVAHNHVMTAPRMIRAAARRWLERAPEIRLREGSDVSGDAQFNRRVIKPSSLCSIACRD